MARSLCITAQDKADPNQGFHVVQLDNGNEMEQKVKVYNFYQDFMFGLRALASKAQ